MHRVSLARCFLNKLQAMYEKIRQYKHVMTNVNRTKVYQAILKRHRPDCVTDIQRGFLHEIISVLKLPPALAEHLSSEFFPKHAYIQDGSAVKWSDAVTPLSRSTSRHGSLVQGDVSLRVTESVCERALSAL